MITRSLGYVTVAAAGTPKLLSTVLTALHLTGLKVRKLELRPLLSNTGIVYVGLTATAPGSAGLMNVSSGVSVLYPVTVPAATGRQDKVCLVSPGNGNSVNVADYALDVTNNGEGFCIFTEED